MLDLNDLHLFAMVVSHRGFAAVERALGVPKSRLSRRIRHLEDCMGARLIQRTTRSFRVTDIGLSVYRHAQAMLIQARAAREVSDLAGDGPRGIVRVVVPLLLAQVPFQRLLPAFLRRHPQVDLRLNVVADAADIADAEGRLVLRVAAIEEDASERSAYLLGHVRERLVASPGYLARCGHPSNPDELPGHASIGDGTEDAQQHWDLLGPGGQTQRIQLQPRLSGVDFGTRLAMARAGAGIARLPELACADSVRSGELDIVMPQWPLPTGYCQATLPPAYGSLPAVRAFMEFLSDCLPREIERSALG